MRKRHTVAAVLGGAALLLGVGCAAAAALPNPTPPAHSPAITDEPGNGADTPGLPDPPEPGDTPD